MAFVWIALGALFGYLLPRTAAERQNLLLRQQLIVARRARKRFAFGIWDRWFWMAVSRWFEGWRECLVILQPETVLDWQRRGFRYYWRRLSRGKPGRKRIALETRELIRRFARENPLWGTVRIWAELLKLGIFLSPRTVAKYRRRPWSGVPSPRWREFLGHHAREIWACDFLCLRTITFDLLFLLVILKHGTREIVHARVTRHPTAAWVSQQLRNACFDHASPRYLIHDRDSIFGTAFRQTARDLGMRPVRTPYRAPKANALVERVNGALRRECFDHVMVLNERHAQRVATAFAHYYNRHRPHRSLQHRPPQPANDASPCTATGPPQRISVEPVLGGLHHIYRRAA